MQLVVDLLAVGRHLGKRGLLRKPGTEVAKGTPLVQLISVGDSQGQQHFCIAHVRRQRLVQRGNRLHTNSILQNPLNYLVTHHLA